MPRATPSLLPLLLLLAAAARAADVFVIADTANQTSAIAEVARETIAEANNDTIGDSVVRRKRTFGDIVFRGLADVLGYNVARKAPQVVFPPPLAPVPGIDTPLQPPQDAPLQVPLALLPVPQANPAPCGRAVAPNPCPAPAPPPPPPPPPKPKAVPPPCPKPRANPKPKPKPKPRPKPQPKPQPPPCGSGRANPTTAAPCAPAPAKPKADSNLETIQSDFRLDFNFNRKPANAAQPAADVAQEQQQSVEQTLELQEQVAAPVVAIRPQAARLPPEPPRKPRVYLDAFVVQNGVTQKIQTIDARNAVQHQADNDFLEYDEPAETPQQQPPPQQPPQQQAQPAPPEDYDYMLDSSERTKSVREFGTAVDKFWDQKKKKMKKKNMPYDYRSVHFGDRDFAPSERGDRDDETNQSLSQEPPYDARAQPQAALDDDDDEVTTTTLNPRRRLKPRVLPPTEKNPNQIDTVTVRVPPIYKEKRPKKLHREQPERPERDEETQYRPYEYSAYGGSDGNGFYGYSPYQSQPSGQYYHGSDTESDNSAPVHQTEQPKRKRRRKIKRKTRSVFQQHYTAGDYDYFGKKLPISQEEQYFRGLTIPPPTRDPDVVRSERAREGNGHFLDDHERLRDDPERIKPRKKSSGRKQSDKDGADESDGSDEAESSDESERLEESERSADEERSGEKERADELGPNARVRETGYKNNFVRAHNVQVDDNQPLVRTVKRKKLKKA